MTLTLDEVKKRYQFEVCKVLTGEEVVKTSKCSRWVRNKELKQEKDIIYIQLKILYQGVKAKDIVFRQFHLEDTEGYFSDATPPEDYLDAQLNTGGTATGGLIFSLYQDVNPSRLWFDTELFYQNSKDAILIDIALPMASAQTRTEFLTKEELAHAYTREMKRDSLKSAQPSVNETQVIVKKISKECGIPYKKVPNGYLLRILLPDSRKQNVILNFSGKDKNGNELVTIGTICAPVASAKTDRLLLKLNTKLDYGAVGVSAIRGEDYYVITETYPAKTIDTSVISQAIVEIAAKGDWLENKLTQGLDVH